MPVPIPPHPTEAGEDGVITMPELGLATRNHGMPLEAMRWDHTPAGLHYLLIHYDIPLADPTTWTLEIDGAVRAHVTLGLAGLAARTQITTSTTMECAGNGRALFTSRALSQPWLHEAVGTAAWTGALLDDLLDEVGLDDDVVELVFTGADRGVEGGIVQQYERALAIGEVRGSGALVAREMNGAPLAPQHGFPLRLVVPGWYGMTNVKWLTRITAVTTPFSGHQNRSAYRIRQDPDEPGTPVTRIVPRALLVPPGIPDFFSRQRLLAPGPCMLEGRAWSGWAPIASVDVSTNGGGTWFEAELDAAPRDPHMWRRFTAAWDAAPGDHELRCRCRDQSGRAQPADPAWNVGGYQNNASQRVLVTVDTTPEGALVAHSSTDGDQGG